MYIHQYLNTMESLRDSRARTTIRKNQLSVEFQRKLKELEGQYKQPLQELTEQDESFADRQAVVERCLTAKMIAKHTPAIFLSCDRLIVTPVKNLTSGTIEFGQEYMVDAVGRAAYVDLLGEREVTPKRIDFLLNKYTNLIAAASDGFLTVPAYVVPRRVG